MQWNSKKESMENVFWCYIYLGFNVMFKPIIWAYNQLELIVSYQLGHSKIPPWKWNPGFVTLSLTAVVDGNKDNLRESSHRKGYPGFANSPWQSTCVSYRGQHIFVREDQEKLTLLIIICLAWNLAKRAKLIVLKKISFQLFLPVRSYPSYSLYPVMGSEAR